MMTRSEELKDILKKMVDNLFDFKDKLNHQKEMHEIANELKLFLRHIKEIQYYRENHQRIESIITTSTNLAKAFVKVSRAPSQVSQEITQTLIKTINNLVETITLVISSI